MGRTAEHPSTRRRVDGFAGLRLVSGPHDGESEIDVPFEVRVRVVDGRVSIEWEPLTDLRCLSDVGDVIAAAFAALARGQDVDDKIQAAYERKRSWRVQAESMALEYEQSHPWVCTCGRRCKTSGGLTNHRNAGGPRCG
jgi:hypothetical protein